MNMFHSYCKSNVYLVLNHIKLLGAFTVTSKGVTPLSIVAKNVNNGDSKVSLYCPTCNTIADIENIHTNCSNCGKEITIKDTYKPKKSGGMYCSDCIPLLNEEYTPVLKLIQTYTIN
jgi:hypothetical protein